MGVERVTHIILGFKRENDVKIGAAYGRRGSEIARYEKDVASGRLR